jgi:hypothetical protein
MLQRYLPADRVFIDPVEPAFINHMAARDGTIGLDNAR